MFIQELKVYLKKRWLKTIFVIFLLLLLISFNRDISKNKPFQSLPQNKIAQGLPVRLVIPVINVNAVIQQVGVTTKGEMEVPNNITDVGWFDLGSRPGEKGSAVIAGHFNGENGEIGVFSNLYKLKEGDEVYVKDNIGKLIAFRVIKKHTYDPGYAEEVFSPNNKEYLNLITCDGFWDGNKKIFSKRLVIFTEKN